VVCLTHQRYVLTAASQTLVYKLVYREPWPAATPSAHLLSSCKSLVFMSAPGRIRTCDRRIRSPLLCPLSYGRIRLIYAGNPPPGPSLIPRCQQYVSSSPSEGLVNRVGQPAVHPLDNVAIGVERDVYACVAQELLDELGMLACHEEYCSARML
jgi:hypothetical protein